MQLKCQKIFFSKKKGNHQTKNKVKLLSNSIFLEICSFDFGYIFYTSYQKKVKTTHVLCMYL